MCTICSSESQDNIPPERYRYYRILDNGKAVEKIDPCIYSSTDDYVEYDYNPPLSSDIPYYMKHTLKHPTYATYPERHWKRLRPPKNHDVFIPSSLDGQYHLYFPETSPTGLPLRWTFKHQRDRLNQFETNCCPTISRIDKKYVQLKPEEIPHMPRIIGYREPPYLTDFPGHIVKEKPQYSPLPLKPIHIPKLSNVDNTSAVSHTEKGEGWSVFHCLADHANGGNHTIVCIGNTIVEVRPASPIQIIETTRNEWFSRYTHQKAVCLGEKNSHFLHCYLAYSEAIPKTHVLIGNFSLHIDNALPLVFTRAADGCTVSQ